MSFREEFLKASGTHRVEPVDTPSGRTYVRTMTAGDKDELEMSGFKDDHKFRCRVVLLCCCDESGRLEFGQKDLPAIDAVPAEFLDPIVDAALRLNKLTEADREELRKNSGTPAADHSTA